MDAIQNDFGIDVDPCRFGDCAEGAVRFEQHLGRASINHEIQIRAVMQVSQSGQHL
ncbi:hypothetical protein D3C72_2455410 [compost metagenome]